MKNLLLLLALTTLILPSCKDDDPVVEPGVDFNITFKATYDGNQLVRYQDYVFGSFPIEIENYRLYLCDISLIKESGEAVRISEVEYLNFTPDGTGDSTVTPRITFKNVPAGMYSGIRMGFGVRADLNAKDPSDFPAGSPLAVETDYWGGWKSYIFQVLDGKADPEGDGSKNLGFSYHCGSDPVYRTFTYNEHIHVEDGHQGIGIEIDIRQLLTKPDGSLFDIVSDPFTSNSVNDIRVAKAIMDRYAYAVSIKQ